MFVQKIFFYTIWIFIPFILSIEGKKKTDKGQSEFVPILGKQSRKSLCISNYVPLFKSKLKSTITKSYKIYQALVIFYWHKLCANENFEWLYFEDWTEPPFGYQIFTKITW